MTEIILSCKVKYPTKKINDESIQPLLSEFKKKIKDFMEDNCKDKKVIIGRTKKKDNMKRFIPDAWMQRVCPICDRKFKTAHNQEYCGRCRLEMEKNGLSPIELRRTLVKQGKVRNGVNKKIEPYGVALGKTMKLVEDMSFLDGSDI